MQHVVTIQRKQNIYSICHKGFQIEAVADTFIVTFIWKFFLAIAIVMPLNKKTMTLS